MYSHRLAMTDSLRVSAVLAMRQARWDDARSALEEALTLTAPLPYAAAKAFAAYGVLEAARGEPERAREHYTAASAILSRLGERLFAETIERAMSELP